MAVFKALILFPLIFIQSNVWLVCTAKHVHHSSYANHFLRGVEANVITNASLWAPHYRIITAGGARMTSMEVHDVGPRAGECQCRETDGTNSRYSLVAVSDSLQQRLMKEIETCCLPKSNDRAPFCVSNSSTCCSDTYCDDSEMCCGDFCCPSVSSSSEDYEPRSESS